MLDKRQAFGFVALLSVAVILPFIGETVFYSKGEPREAIVAVSMLESGNWILPVNYGTDIAYKPPFLYWCIAAFSLVPGRVTEFTSRLPSALSFLAMQMVFFRFVARRKDTQTALVVSLLLLTSFEVHRAAVACRLDMLQVSLIVISLCLLFRWDEKGAKGIPWAAVLLMACATLTKGPVGSILPCTCIGICQLLRGRAFFKTFGSLLLTGLLTLVPLGIWFYAAYLQGGQPFADLMLEENTGRFAGTMSYESHYNPVWYNFLTVIWGWIPWTPVLFFSLFGLSRKGIRLLPAGGSPGQRLAKAWNAFRNQPPLQLLTWVTILFIFAFYCIPKSKRSVYLLPIYPFMALLIARYLLSLADRRIRVLRTSAYVFASLCFLLTMTFAAVRLGLVPDSVWGNGRHAAENAGFVHALESVPLPVVKWLLVVLPVVAGLCTLRALARKAGGRPLLYATAGCMLCLFVSLDGVYQPAVLAAKSDKKLAECFSRYVPQGCIYSYTDRLIRFYCANYYLNDRMRNFTQERPEGEGYVAVSVNDRESFLDYCNGTYRVEEVHHTPYRSCDLRAEILIYRFTKQ